MAGQGRRVLYYVDPMHPSYRSDKPGIAPDCGMKLSPVFEDPAGIKNPNQLAGEPLSSGSVRVSEATQRLIGLQLQSVAQVTDSDSLTVVGRVYPEDSRVYRINSGVDGFVRETFKDSVGMLVSKNQKLATYYAPEFLAATSGFLAANERVPGSLTTEGTRSIQNYTDRLRNLGMSDAQITHIATTRQYPESIEVVAPADGVVLARNVTAGQHFEHDMELYRIADLSKVWVVAEIEEQDRKYLRPGGVARITMRDSGIAMSARISDALPQSEAAGGTVKLRLEADNPHLTLRPDLLVEVQLQLKRPAAVTIPSDALIDSGSQSRVYVAREGGVLEPRTVETGWRDADHVEIVKGLQAGDRVVVNATFLIDSESRLKAISQTEAP